MKEFVGGEVRVMRRIVGEGRERVIPGKVVREEGDDIKVRKGSVQVIPACAL